MLERTRLYQINLDRRTDRWAECLANHKTMGFEDGLIRRVSACAEPEFGALGCAKSHIKVLTEFFLTETAEFCVVLEDDFDFLMNRDVLALKVETALKRGLDFNVLMLSGTYAKSFPIGLPSIERVLEAQTTCGYIVHRAYVPTLVHCFMKAAHRLDQFRASTPRSQILEWFAIDSAWKVLQKEDKWFIFNPVAGLQRPSYSDIEERHTDYATFFRT